MTSGWLTEACGHPVVHDPCRGIGATVDMTVPAMGVMHTTEASFGSALNEFRQKYAPHFLISASGEIHQLLPLGAMAASLVHQGDPPTNGWARVQIETEAYSKEQPWLWAEPQLGAVAHLLAALSLPNVAAITLKRPFPDKMPQPPWATTSFVRRRSGKWGSMPGWYGHVEVPENDHWDPGYLTWTPLLRLAKQIAVAHSKQGVPHPSPAPDPTPKPGVLPGPSPKPGWFWPAVSAFLRRRKR